jgi:hypothetical protein
MADLSGGPVDGLTGAKAKAPSGHLFAVNRAAGRGKKMYEGASRTDAVTIHWTSDKFSPIKNHA